MSTLGFSLPAGAIETDKSNIRLLSAGELNLLEEHLVRLGCSCRQARFGNVVSENFARAYARGVNCLNTAVFGYFAEGAMRGAGELRSLQSDWCRTAEAAFSVEKSWRRRGIATSLLATLIREAARRGVQEIVVSCHAFNQPVQRMVRRFGARIETEALECMARIEISSERMTLPYSPADDAGSILIVAVRKERSED
jgi:GNAT superfamily N-acetyltransferase